MSFHGNNVLVTGPMSCLEAVCNLQNFNLSVSSWKDANDSMENYAAPFKA